MWESVSEHADVMFAALLENGKEVQQFIETCASVHESTVYKADFYNSNKLQTQYLVNHFYPAAPPEPS